MIAQGHSDLVRHDTLRRYKHTMAVPKTTRRSKASATSKLTIPVAAKKSPVGVGKDKGPKKPATSPAGKTGTKTTGTQTTSGETGTKKGGSQKKSSDQKPKSEE